MVRFVLGSLVHRRFLLEGKVPFYAIMNPQRDVSGTQPPSPEERWTELSDRSLLRRYRSGSQAAATELYRRYAGRLLALARAKWPARFSRRLDGDDIVQSVFGGFFRWARDHCYDALKGQDLWNLLLVAALNKMRTRASFHQAARRDVRLTATAECLDDHQGSRQADHEYAALSLSVDDVLERLQPRQRQVVCLRLQGYRVADIAHLTGRTLRSVERNLQAAREHLSRLFSPES